MVEVKILVPKESKAEAEIIATLISGMDKELLRDLRNQLIGARTVLQSMAKTA